MKSFENQKETSKLSGNVFWDHWDHLVAQKSKKNEIFYAQMTLIHEPPPGEVSTGRSRGWGGGGV